MIGKEYTKLNQVTSPNYILIHGANSSSAIFHPIVTTLGLPNVCYIDYDAGDGFDKNQQNMLNYITEQNFDNVVLIGHSLGSIHAFHLAQELKNVRAGVSISAPWAGSKIARFLKLGLLPTSPLYQIYSDMQHNSQVVRDTLQKSICHDWLNIVSTKTIPFNNFILCRESPNNDGILSIQSMESRDDVKSHRVHADHFTVINDVRTTSLIRNFILDLSL